MTLPTHVLEKIDQQASTDSMMVVPGDLAGYYQQGSIDGQTLWAERCMKLRESMQECLEKLKQQLPTGCQHNPVYKRLKYAIQAFDEELSK